MYLSLLHPRTISHQILRFMFHPYVRLITRCDYLSAFFGRGDIPEHVFRVLLYLTKLTSQFHVSKTRSIGTFAESSSSWRRSFSRCSHCRHHVGRASDRLRGDSEHGIFRNLWIPEIPKSRGPMRDPVSATIRGVLRLWGVASNVSRSYSRPFMPQKDLPG